MLPKSDHRRSPLSWRSVRDPVRRGSLPAWRDRAETLPGCPVLARSYSGKTTGAAQGNRSQALPRGCSPESEQSRRGIPTLKEIGSCGSALELRDSNLEVKGPEDFEPAFRSRNARSALRRLLVSAGRFSNVTELES